LKISSQKAKNPVLPVGKRGFWSIFKYENRQKPRKYCVNSSLFLLWFLGAFGFGRGAACAHLAGPVV
jgi:hypothetical protein